jgi:hypothetical protein
MYDPYQIVYVASVKKYYIINILVPNCLPKTVNFVFLGYCTSYVTFFDETSLLKITNIFLPSWQNILSILHWRTAHRHIPKNLHVTLHTCFWQDDLKSSEIVEVDSNIL